MVLPTQNASIPKVQTNHDCTDISWLTTLHRRPQLHPPSRRRRRRCRCSIQLCPRALRFNNSGYQSSYLFRPQFVYGDKGDRGDDQMRLIGLTGGIASGKSTVSSLFKDAGVPVVDADIIARTVVKKGTGGWTKVVKAFGNDILLDDGEIDRARLGQIVFSDPSKRQLLNRLLAPHISAVMFWETTKLWMKGCTVIILDIPLLFETKMNRWTSPVIVVWVDPQTQIERLMSRDRCPEEQAQNRINTQLAMDWKKSEADIVIDNSGSLDDTKEQFQDVLRKVSEPLTWRERLKSRDGVFSVVICTAVAVLLAQKNLP